MPVTPQPHAEAEAQAESLARLVAVLDASIDAIITIDRHGIIDSVNGATERMFGYRTSELLGQNVSLLMGSPHREAHDGYIERYLSDGGARIIGTGREVEAKRKDGTLFPCDLAVSEFQVNGERMFTGILRDISDRRNAEMESRMRLEELAHAGRLSDLGLTTSTIAHEVNQPLAAIVGFATACQRLLETDSPPLDTLSDALRQIAEQGNRASEIINRIRHLARKREPKIEPLDVNDATMGVLSMLSEELRQANVDVALNLCDDLPAVRGDRVHVEQVIMNLVRNALEALRGLAEAPRRIVVITAAVDDYVRLTVADSGPGLGEDGESKVFESFYTTKPSGLGLGLAICQALAEAQGGRLWAEPDAGYGAVFHFELATTQ